MQTDPPWKADPSWNTGSPWHSPRRNEAIWLLLASAASLLLAPPAVLAAILSPMVFDPAPNLLSPAAWAAFLLMVTLWVVCIAAPFGAWVAFLRRLPRLTWLAMAAPVIWTAAAVASVSFVR